MKRGPAAAIAGTRSASLELTLGIELTTTFLTALGFPVPGAAANAKLWDRAHSLAFEVRDVEQREVDVARLGQALKGARLSRESPAAFVFFADSKVRMHVITRVLTSRHFAVASTAKSGQSGDFKVDALSDLFGKTTASCTWQSEGSNVISFRGEKAVTFAFAAVPCALQENGSFYFGLQADNLSFGPDGESPSITPQPIFDADGLVEFDRV